MPARPSKRWRSLIGVATLLSVIFPMLDTSRSGAWSAGEQRIQTFGGVGHEFVSQIATNRNGGVVITGSFNDSLQLGTLTFTSRGSYDGFVASFDAEGNLLWAKQIGGAGTEYLQSVGTDFNGNIYVGGDYSDTFVSDTGTQAHRGNAGLYDIVVLSFDANGNERWSKNYGQTGNDYLNSLSVNADGYIALGAKIGGSVSFGGTSVSNPSTCCFAAGIVKLDSSGAHVWSKSYGPSGMNGVYGTLSVAISTSGKVVASVNDMCACSFSVDGVSKTMSSSGDYLVVEFLSTGQINWAKTEEINGSRWNKSSPRPQEIRYTPIEDVVLMGEFNGTGMFGSTDQVTTQGIDIFVQRISSTGSVSWTRFLSSASSERSLGLAVDDGGAVFISAVTGTEVQFGDLQMMTSRAGGAYPYPTVVKLTSTGTPSWYSVIGGANLAIDWVGNQSLMFGGGFSDGQPMRDQTIVNRGLRDIFWGNLDSMTGSVNQPTTTTTTTEPSSQIPTINSPNTTIAPLVSQIVSSVTTASIPVVVSAPSNSPSTGTSFSVSSKVGKSISSSTLAKAARISSSSTSKVSLSVASASRSVCKVSGLTVKMLKKGNCRVAVVVVPKKGARTSKFVTVKVS